MAVITYEDINPTLIENTTMQKLIRAGTHQAYYITPNSGYVLHDSTHDYEDAEGNCHPGYRATTASCGADYDFATNPRGFHAYKEGDEPAEIYADEASDEDYQAALRSMGVDV